MEHLNPISALSFIESNNNIIVLKHDFREDESGVCLQPGVSVSPTDAMGIVESLLPEKKGLGFIPNNLFFQDKGVFGWVIPSSQRELFFNVSGRKTSFQTALPNLVLVSNGVDFFIFGAKTKNIKPTTPLFYAPLMNIYIGGKMCKGSTAFPLTVSVENLNEWEDLLFNTFNSHVNHEKTLNKNCKVSTTDYMKAMKKLGGEGRKFPNQLLTPANLTVQELIKKVA